MQPRRLPAVLGQLAQALRALCDWRSRLRFLALRLGLGGRVRLVPLRLRALGGHALWVRPRTSDAVVVVEDFVHGYADPPAELEGMRPMRIVELGSNIGAGLAALAHTYPQSFLLGVEADPGNAALARRNVEPWADRCRLVEAVVSDRPGRFVIDGEAGRESEFTVRPAAGAEAPRGGELRAVTVDELLADFHRGEKIDYMYVDLEGTHERLLGGEAPWLERVRVVKVSRNLGTDYSEEDCARDLERLGFRARVVPLEPTGWTIGVRA